MLADVDGLVVWSYVTVTLCEDDDETVGFTVYTDLCTCESMIHCWCYYSHSQGSPSYISIIQWRVWAIAVAYLEPRHTSKMECSAKVVNSLKP